MAETKKTESPAGAAHGEHGGEKEVALYRIPADHPWSKLWLVALGVAVIGGILCGVAASGDSQRFAFSYLTAFAWGWTIAMGGLFFVILQHVTRANWSLVVRRGAEHIMIALPAFLLLFIPVILFREKLYPWLGEAAKEPSIAAKLGYLNFGRWISFALVYFAIWTAMAYAFWSWSRKNDETGELKYMRKARYLSAPSIPLFALTLTFAAFDWLMSLQPAWYSTMFGVYIFAGSTVSIMALLSLVFTRMQAAGVLKHNEVNNEHFHDLGKLTLAFVIFWAYISFSQYLLIWYANIPEETVFFGVRQDNGWGTLSITIVFAHFVFPFLLTLSRHTKRFAPSRALFGLWMPLVHYLDMYWLVMPNFKPHGEEVSHFAFSALDLGPLLLVGGVLFAVMFRSMLSMSLVPARDPRIGRALAFENA